MTHLANGWLVGWLVACKKKKVVIQDLGCLYCTAVLLSYETLLICVIQFDYFLYASCGGSPLPFNVLLNLDVFSTIHPT